jgi:hypothetical protein|tara:strand:+ start:860 stop:1444 length:585 start_codon:yes stop_codon:yes gene_type:complete
MGRVININKIENEITKLKANGGMWEIGPGKFAIKHLELEKLANTYNIETNVEIKHCNLEKGCAVVKAVATFNGKSFYTLGEVSPLNNDFIFPVAVAEKRAADRAILKALGIHGNIYSSEELSNIKNNINENTGTDLNQETIILERIKNASHQANLEMIKSQNKDFLTQLKKQDLKRYEKLKQAFLNRNQQFTGG